MKYLKTYTWFFILITVYLSSCSSSLPETAPKLTATEPPPTSAIEALQDTPAITTTAVPDTIPSSVSDITATRKCPMVIPIGTSPLWSKGSVLFQRDTSGIWAISAKDTTPVLVHEDSWLILSDDGTSLMRFEQDELGSIEGDLIIYDLISGEEIRTRRQADWFILWDWLSDGRIKFLVSLERTFSVGEKREFALVNPNTDQYEIIVEYLDLPGYQFYEEPFYTGIASKDPSDQFVLYTMQGEQGTADVILRDRQTDSIIWRQEGTLGTHGYPHPVPKWSGDRILFSMHVSEANNEFYKIFSLTIDGQLEQLPPQPFPLLDQDWQLGYLDRSPNERYIYYNVWQLNQEGPGFIVDTVTSETSEICDPSTTFLGGQWISESQFLYRIRKEDGRKSLRVLDIPSWTTQELVEVGLDSGLTDIGWTPVEFP